MSAEILRRAAALMRERAEAADADNQMWRDDVSPLLEVSDGTFAQAASWHPAVALAVADWLDSEARLVETFIVDEDEIPTEALAVARAYLGESA